MSDKPLFIEIDYYEKYIAGYTIRTMRADLQKIGVKNINTNNISTFCKSPNFSGYLIIKMAGGDSFYVKSSDWEKLNNTKESESKL